MTTALMIGSAFGALAGLIHACAVYVHQVGRARDRLAAHPFGVRANAAYFALWTFSLWVLFGSYVLFLWIISVMVYACHVVQQRLHGIIRAK